MAILASIEAARTAKLKDQLHYRKVINQAIATPSNDTHLKKLDALGFEGIAAQMVDQRFPPTQQEWKAIRGIEWSQVLERKKLNEIADLEIRYAALHFLEVSEHSKRLEAMATFYGMFGATCKAIHEGFAIWKACSILKILSQDCFKKAAN